MSQKHKKTSPGRIILCQAKDSPAGGVEWGIGVGEQKGAAEITTSTGWTKLRKPKLHEDVTANITTTIIITKTTTIRTTTTGGAYSSKGK